MNAQMKINKSLSVAMISSCCVFMLSLYLSTTEILTSISYTLHELNSLVLNLWLVMLPLVILAWLVRYRRYRRALRRARRDNKEISQKTTTNTVLNVASVLSALITAALVIYMINVVTTSGCVNEFEKYANDGTYYMTFKDSVTLQISKEQYDMLKEGKWYNFEYSYNKLFPGKFTLKKLVQDELE